MLEGLQSGDAFSLTSKSAAWALTVLTSQVLVELSRSAASAPIDKYGCPEV